MNGKNRKIMIVERSNNYFQILAEKLLEKDYEVIRASEGFDLFIKAKRENPSLIMIDIVLPQLDGLAICKLLKSKARFKQTPIILTTSRIDSSLQELSVRSGANELVERKDDPMELLALVENYLKKMETPIETPKETARKTSIETPKETARKTPIETPKETARETARKTPGRAPGETPRKIFRRTPREKKKLENPSRAIELGDSLREMAMMKKVAAEKSDSEK